MVEESTGFTSTSSPAPRPAGRLSGRCPCLSRTCCSTARRAGAGCASATGSPMPARSSGIARSARPAWVTSARSSRRTPPRNRWRAKRLALQRMIRNGSLARPVQHDRGVEPGSRIQPDQQDAQLDPQAGEDRDQHGGGPGHAGQGAYTRLGRVDGLSKISDEAAGDQGHGLGLGLPAPQGADRLQVTLRGRRMYEFLDRLISGRLAAYPRLPQPESGPARRRQLHALGLSRSSSPRSTPDRLQHTQGMDVSIVSTTKSDDQARELLRAFQPTRSTCPQGAGETPGQDQGPLSESY